MPCLLASWMIEHWVRVLLGFASGVEILDGEMLFRREEVVCLIITFFNWRTCTVSLVEDTLL